MENPELREASRGPKERLPPETSGIEYFERGDKLSRRKQRSF